MAVRSPITRRNAECRLSSHGHRLSIAALRSIVKARKPPLHDRLLATVYRRLMTTVSAHCKAFVGAATVECERQRRLPSA